MNALKRQILPGFLSHHAGWVALCSGCMIATSFSLAASADALRRVVDHIQSIGATGLWLPLALTCALQIIHYISKFALASAARHLQAAMCTHLRMRVMRFAHRVPYALFEKKRAGGYLSVLQNDADNASFYMYIILSRIGMSAATVLFTIPFMLRVNIPLTITVMSVSILFGLINQRINVLIKRNEAKARSAQEKIAALALSGYDSADSLSAYRAEGFIQSLHHIARRQYSRSLMRVEAIDSARMALYIIVDRATLFGSIIFLAWRIVNGRGGLGSAISFNILLTQAMVAIEMLFRWYGTLVRSNASWDRLYDLLQDEPEEVERSNHVAPDVRTFKVENLSYAHEVKRPMLEGLSLSCKRGCIYGICGASGSGKTTLIKCLLGLYEADNSTFQVNGLKINPEERAGLFAYVPSDHMLFQGTLLENLTLGNAKLDKQDCLDAMECLGLQAWFEELGGDINHPIDFNGGNLSGGQKQVVCILRAILSQRAIIILDEPFASLDQHTARIIEKALLSIKQDYIIFITSHRSVSMELYDSVINI
ncbi:MAG: ABC transporter ATP-binding protein/permease [Clostridiales bacterium]|jgi:ATP-binding cassette subfamily B protein|nr:ABC transporter ATP-binding protein/permease [Clostridiales bacterium]